MSSEEQFPPLLNAEIGHKELVLRVTPMPSDCNINGDIFGGWLMGQVDIAGAILACRAANGKKVVTVGVDSFAFKHTVAPGNLLSFYAQVLKIGTTSVKVQVSVYAWNYDNFDKEAIKVTESTLTYVTVDQNGNKIPVLD